MPSSRRLLLSSSAFGTCTWPIRRSSAHRCPSPYTALCPRTSASASARTRQNQRRVSLRTSLGGGRSTRARRMRASWSRPVQPACCHACLLSCPVCATTLQRLRVRGWQVADGRGTVRGVTPPSLSPVQARAAPQLIRKPAAKPRPGRKRQLRIAKAQARPWLGFAPRLWSLAGARGLSASEVSRR